MRPSTPPTASSTRLNRRHRCSSPWPCPIRPTAPRRFRRRRPMRRTRARWRTSVLPLVFWGCSPVPRRGSADRAHEPLGLRADRPVNASRFRSAAVIGSTIWLLLALPATVWAHANLERAEPPPGSQLDQPPRQLQLFFSEAVDGSFSRVQLLNAQRDAVDRGDSHVAPNDPRALA